MAITQQSIHEYVQNAPLFSNEISLIKRMEPLLEKLPKDRMLIPLRNDWFDIQPSYKSDVLYHSQLFEKITVEQNILRFEQFCNIKPVYCPESSGFDPSEARLYLQRDSFIALLIFADQMESDLRSSSAIIRLLLQDEFSIFQQELLVRNITFAVFFLFILHNGYKAALADYWIGEGEENPIRTYCTHLKLLEIRDEVYSVQLDFCKALYGSY